MICTIQYWAASFHRCCSRACSRILIAFAIIAVGPVTSSVYGQSSKAQGSSPSAEWRSATVGDLPPHVVRVASNQKQPPTNASKPAPQPAKQSTRKLATKTVAAPGTTEPAQSADPEELPTLPMKGVVPLAGSSQGTGLKLSQNKDGKITLIVRDKPLSQVLALLAQKKQLNIVASNDIDAVISITLRDVPLEEALTSILAVANYTWVKRNNIILITSVADSVNLPANVQGRQIQVFDLDFASASVVSETIQNFLSPIGKVSVSASSKTNNRLTQERVVVEDLPESLARITDYIAQVDHPPRQVLIEAHVLQVTLDDTTRCGVNLDRLMRISHADLHVKTTGFADPSADTAFLATLDGGHMDGVIEALQTTTDAKTLGSPKLLVLNEQEARLQVGEHLGFKTSTTTDTSTIQNVQFLDVGVVLRMTPRITRDGCVLLHVRPEVSKGDVNPETGLPESQTAELETDVMLNDGQGMIIGGLIKENDSVQQSKIPYLGNMKAVGWLFRRSEVTKERVEIIVALVPRVQPYDCKYQAYEQGELVRSDVPLFHGPLCRTDRPWDPVLPDGKRVKYPVVPEHRRRPTGYFHEMDGRYVIPPHPLPEQHFCSDTGECENSGWQSTGDAADPVEPDIELPLPAAADDNSAGGHFISDQHVTPKPAGAQR